MIALLFRKEKKHITAFDQNDRNYLTGPVGEKTQTSIHYSNSTDT